MTATLDLTPVFPDSGTFAIWWLGQSGFLVSYGGAWLCFDPYLSDSLTNKYAATEKPHVRMKPIVIEPSKLSFVDIATSSHNHTDHLDAETLLAMRPQNLVIPEANRDFVAHRLRCDRMWPVGLAPGEAARIGPFTFHAVPAKHNELGPEYLGYVVQFGAFRIYHAGDTLLYDGMVETLKPFAVDLALLPINGNLPERKVPGNLDAKEAAWLGHEIGARLVIPCHYDMFTFNAADPADFVREAQATGQPHHVMQLGERFLWEA